MATWRAFAEQAPELAQAGERLFQEHEVAYLATTSPAGWPRLSPFCPAVDAGHLWAFIIEESPKRAHLDANGRFAIHAMPGDEDEQFLVTGRAAREADPALREPALVAMPYADADERHILYEFFPLRAIWTTWVNFQRPGMKPVHRSWREGSSG